MTACVDTKPNLPTGMKEYPIAGHTVRFPRQPYGAQIVFMQRLITAIQNRNNALLEAPTGCGKTLAILCGALAWQSKAKHDADELEGAEEVSLDDMRLTQGSPGFTQAAREGDEIDAGYLPEDADVGGHAVKAQVPRVYYATRTHSQIAQVANELKNTGYTPKMAILGSRKQYCINESVRQSPAGIDNACRDKIETQKGCEFFKGKEKTMAAAHRAPPVHDIEDLVQFGQKEKACPFFISRDLNETAELVFCPYNYIVDPAIRSAMSIDLTGSVVIFDEAHNIEDAAREAGSIDFTLEDVEAAITDTLKNMEDDVLGGPFRQLNGMLTRLKVWLQKYMLERGAQLPAAKEAFEAICRPRGAHVTSEVCRSSGVVKLDGTQLQCLWSGGQIRTHLSEAGLDPASNSDTSACIAQAKKDMESEKNKAKGAKTDKSGTLAITFLESLMETLSLVYGMVEQGPDAHNGSDYRLVVTSWKEQPIRSARSRYVREAAMDGQPCVQLSLWCMNPACVFREIGEKTRSVIVTSGTLSPMISFASELGISFPGPPLTTAHVVPEDQVLPMVLARSSSNYPFKATFHETNQPRFQDGVIDALTSMAKVVPDGMLVFMPSYGMLNKLVTRWEQTRAWRELKKIKPLWTEPQGGSAEDLEKSIQEYYEAIKEGMGGIFFAVCRGKVSEGINFADEHARAVILVGIPYPAFKDSKVEQKKAYNDHKDSQQRGLISGSRWYSLQAYRAMNQALGRCIRHKQDYGAIILMEERMLDKKNQMHLSQWVRNRMGNQQIALNQACQQMSTFFTHCENKMGRAREEAALNEEKLVLKDEKVEVKAETSPVRKEEAEVLDEKPLVKDEKCAVRQENQTAGDVPAGLSTQALWAEPPQGKQCITVAQAMPSNAAIHSADVDVQPKLEDSDARLCNGAVPKSEQCAQDCAQNATVKEEKDEDVQLVTPKSSVRDRFKSRGSMRQSSLKSSFLGASKKRPSEVTNNNVAADDKHVDQNSGAGALQTSAEQNVPDNGQGARLASGNTPDVIPDQQAVKVKEELQSSVQLHQETVQPPLQNRNTAAGAACKSTSVSPDMQTTPWPAPAAQCTAAAHGCRVDTAPTSVSPLPGHSQAFAQTPLTANLSGQHRGMASAHGTATCCGNTAAQIRSCEYTAQPNNLCYPSNPANAGCQPPTKLQRVNQPDHAQAQKPPSAPSLHPADVELLESGFLDSDSDDDVVPVQPGNTLQETPMPSGAPAAPQRDVRFGAAQPARPLGQVQFHPAAIQSWTAGLGPPAQHVGGWDTWGNVSWLLFQHDMKQMERALQHSKEHGGAYRVYSSLVQVLDDACKHLNLNGNMAAWCREQMQHGVLPIGVAMIVRLVESPSHCNEIWRDLDTVLSSAEFIGSVPGTVAWLGALQVPQALSMLLESYQGFQQRCCQASSGAIF